MEIPLEGIEMPVSEVDAITRHKDFCQWWGETDRRANYNRQLA
jgi:hypothetical protein